MKRGFTYIELLIVIAVLGLLAALFVNTTAGSGKKARDARRQSDLKQYQTALEVYASKSGGFYPSYPIVAGENAATTLCTTLGQTNCPNDPLISSQANRYYRFQSNGTGAASATGTQYLIWGQLENTTGYWVVCSNGKSGIVATVSNSAFGECATGL